MEESKRRRRRESTALKEHLFFNSRISKFGRCVVALWPDNPGKMLADKLGVTVENANQIIRGDRKVTGRAAHVVAGEWFERN